MPHSFPATAARLGGRFRFRPLDAQALEAALARGIPPDAIACADDPDRGTRHEGTVELLPDDGDTALAKHARDFRPPKTREFTGTRKDALHPQEEKVRRARARSALWRADLAHHFGGR